MRVAGGLGVVVVTYGAGALNVVRYTFSGRTARQALAAGAGPEQLLETAEKLLGRHFPVRAADRRGYVARRFDPGLCAYGPHYARLRRDLDGALAGLSGLALAGDYLAGASIEACFHSARASVERLLRAAPAAHVT